MRKKCTICGKVRKIASGRKRVHYIGEKHQVHFSLQSPVCNKCTTAITNGLALSMSMLIVMAKSGK